MKALPHTVRGWHGLCAGRRRDGPRAVHGCRHICRELWSQDTLQSHPSRNLPPAICQEGTSQVLRLLWLRVVPIGDSGCTGAWTQAPEEVPARDRAETRSPAAGSSAVLSLQTQLTQSCVPPDCCGSRIHMREPPMLFPKTSSGARRLRGPQPELLAAADVQPWDWGLSERTRGGGGRGVNSSPSLRRDAKADFLCRGWSSGVWAAAQVLAGTLGQSCSQSLGHYCLMWPSLKFRRLCFLRL